MKYSEIRAYVDKYLEHCSKEDMIKLYVSIKDGLPSPWGHYHCLINFNEEIEWDE